MMNSLADEDREILRKALDKCTLNQIALFNRMYGSIDTIPHEKMDWAYQQIKRTLEKNAAKQEIPNDK